MNKKLLIKGIPLGMLVGFLSVFLICSGFAVGGSPLKLIINNKEVVCDPAPQIINNSVMVPARSVAENLGATVEWDSAGNTVKITGSDQSETAAAANSQPAASEKDSPLPLDSLQKSTDWSGLPKTTLYGMEALTYNNEIYVNAQDAISYYKVNGAVWNKNDKTLNFPLYHKSFKLNELSGSDVFVYQGRTYIKEWVIRHMANEKEKDDYDNFKKMFRVKKVGKSDSAFQKTGIDLIYSGSKNLDEFLKEWLSMSQETRDSFAARYATQDLSRGRNSVITFYYNDETVLGQLWVTDGKVTGSLMPYPY